MGARPKPRQSVHYCAGLALALAPLTLTSAAPAGSSTAVGAAAPAATRAAELPFGDGQPSDWAPSRSANRFGPLPAAASAGAAEAAEKAELRVSSPKGTQLWTASAMSDHGLPAAAERAYRRAARTTRSTDPSCQLPWTLLAGIGRVESDHGRYGGSVLGTDGVSRPRILGVQLDGAGPVAAIPDTDDGKLDGDKVWDRAVGPMQFIPSTWAGAARDGDGDGEASPDDLDDAALAAAAYLCSGYGSVLGDTAMAAAVFRYNQDDYYVALVLAFERGYRTGVFVLPPPPEPEDDKPQRKERERDREQAGDTGRDGPRGDRDGQREPTSAGDDDTRPEPSPSPSPKPKPKPGPTRSPSPSPTPADTDEDRSEGPVLTGLSGTLNACDAPSGWCADDTPLELGSDTQLAREAANDYSGDGDTATNSGELDQLNGEPVELQVEKKEGTAVVYVINGDDYRYADGSYA